MSRPWMPFYVADYIADTMHLSTIEHGAYLLLIMHYWQNGALPHESTKLARIARMTAKEWSDVEPTIAEMFQAGWRHKRIDEELSEAKAKYERRAEAGRKGGQAKQSITNAQANAEPSLSNATIEAQAMLPNLDSNAEAYAGDAGGNSQPQPHSLNEKKEDVVLSVSKSRKAKAPIYPSQFELLVHEYDEHDRTVKARAFKSWNALSEEDQDRCLDAVGPYNKMLERERQRGFPRTKCGLQVFINDRRFDDLLGQKAA